MAKSRAKTGRAARGRKGAAKKRARPSRGPRQVQLKPVFNSLNTSLERLERVEQTGEVKKAIARLTRCLREIDGICGSDMVIPVARQKVTR